MTDTNKLKELAERAVWWGKNIGDESWYPPEMFTQPYFSHADAGFLAAANPQAILGLISRLDGLLEQHGRDSAELRALCQARDDARKERDRLKAENEALRQFAAEAYQVLGALDAPENVLDNASDAASGVPPRHETLLPFFAEGYEALRKDAERYRALVESGKYAPSAWGMLALRTGPTFYSKDQLDAAIDAALEGGGR